MRTLARKQGMNSRAATKKNKTRETQPKFFKRVVFEKDIILSQGTEYFCSIWENDDGSVNLGIKAKSELPDKNVDEFNDEPKSIGELISKCGNKYYC